MRTHYANPKQIMHNQDKDAELKWIRMIDTLPPAPHRPRKEKKEKKRKKIVIKMKSVEMNPIFTIALHREFPFLKVMPLFMFCLCLIQIEF